MYSNNVKSIEYNYLNLFLKLMSDDELRKSSDKLFQLWLALWAASSWSKAKLFVMVFSGLYYSNV